jgi:hypothetical protein
MERMSWAVRPRGRGDSPRAPTSLLRVPGHGGGEQEVHAWSGRAGRALRAQTVAGAAYPLQGRRRSAGSAGQEDLVHRARLCRVSRLLVATTAGSSPIEALSTEDRTSREASRGGPRRWCGQPARS